MSHAAVVGRPDGLPRTGADVPMCDFCGTLGHKVLANLVVRVAEKGDLKDGEYFRGCQDHRRQALLVCLGISLRDPQVSYLDLEEDAGWMPFAHMHALHLLATLEIPSPLCSLIGF